MKLMSQKADWILQNQYCPEELKIKLKKFEKFNGNQVNAIHYEFILFNGNIAKVDYSITKEPKSYFLYIHISSDAHPYIIGLNFHDWMRPLDEPYDANTLVNEIQRCDAIDEIAANLFEGEPEYSKDFIVYQFLEVVLNLFKYFE